MKKIQDVKTPGQLPVRVVQFGEGNFLRAFVDYMLDIANEDHGLDCGVAIVKPITFGSLDNFKKQDNLYTVMLRGKENGQVKQETRIVSSVMQTVDPFRDPEAYAALAKTETLRFVVSNTTEAGIVYHDTDRPDDFEGMTFPGKVTLFLLERFRAFHGAADKGLIFLPVELIEKNGVKLKEYVLSYAKLWSLPGEFVSWVETANIFCSTLVDRIVTGYPKAEIQEIWEKNGYMDELLVTGEPFALWVVESDRMEEVEKELPLPQMGLPVVYTKDITPYRERKVRLLNGAHTGTVLAAACMGKETVLECMEDPTVRSYMDRLVMGEIAPTVHLPAEEVKAFAASVFERFENPFIRHLLSSIALNSVSKWKSRILPSLKDSLAMGGKLPDCLTFSFVALYYYYTTKPIQDDEGVLAFFADKGSLGDFARRADFWGEDLTALPGFAEKTAGYLALIEEKGMTEAVKSL